MFDFSQWIVDGLINGYKTKTMSFPKITELTANYLIKSVITQEQANRIAAECPSPLYKDNIDNIDNVGEVAIAKNVTTLNESETLENLLKSEVE